MVSFRFSSALKKKKSSEEDALEYFKSIESDWKGHEKFAVWLIRKIHPKTTVDLGFHKGLSTLAFAFHNPYHVYAIDWFEGGNYLAKSMALDSAFQNISNAISYNYVKNIHLIIGPSQEVVKNWRREIDLLHIDLIPSYEGVLQQYEIWAPFLKDEAPLLVHNLHRYPKGPGRFFYELNSPKAVFPIGHGLGVICKNGDLIEEIKRVFLPERKPGPIKGSQELAECYL